MIEKLIELETAKLAKEKGFDRDVHYWWGERGYKDDFQIRSCETGNINRHKDAYSAPTQTQLKEWLYEYHNIFVAVDFLDTLGFYVSVYKIDKKLRSKCLFTKYGLVPKLLKEKGLFEALKTINL